MANDPSAALIGFEWSPVALCITRQRVIVACNAAFAALFDYAGEELVGASIAVLYPSQQEFRRIGQRGYPSMRQGRRYQDERLMRRRAGRRCGVASPGRPPTPRFLRVRPCGRSSAWSTRSVPWRR